jgi:molybdate transport system regulatory protein
MWGEGKMNPRFNLWIEIDGKVVLSRWRIKLLKVIDSTGSISSAAESIDVPYRRAWERIKEMERRLGYQLLKTEVGGMGGGGSILTREAKELITRFDRFENGLEDEIQQRFKTMFEEVHFRNKGEINTR